MISLLNLLPNQPAEIISIEGGEGLIRRLNNLGIRKRAVIRKVTGYSRRGPVVVKVNGTQLALGRGMALKIMVEPK